jgi:hypothetical protein
MKPHDLSDYVNDMKNGLTVEKKAKNLYLKSRYEPVDYIIAKEKRSNQIKKGDYNARKKELEGMQYFTVQLADILSGGNKNANDKAAQDKLYYYSYKMQNNFKLVEGGDTLSCRLYHFEIMNDLDGLKTITLAFDKPQNNGNKDKILILDAPILEPEPIKLIFEAKNINNTPVLQTY